MQEFREEQSIGWDGFGEEQQVLLREGDTRRSITRTKW